MDNVEIEKIKGTIIESGRAFVHALSPDEYEYYACTFELINSQLETEEIFHFPIMPSAIAITESMPVSIKKTGRGFLSQVSDSYIGKNITISGTFGKRFKLLVSNVFTNGLALEDLKLKTGYGATKMMDSMIKRSLQPDDYGNPRFLIFHNYAYNLSGIVEVLSFQLTQSMENNMMWNFSIEMKMLADYKAMISYNKDSSNLNVLLAENVLQKSINNLVGDISAASVDRAINRER